MRDQVVEVFNWEIRNMSQGPNPSYHLRGVMIDENGERQPVMSGRVTLVDLKNGIVEDRVNTFALGGFGGE